jgi:hypothetical protein
MGIKGHEDWIKPCFIMIEQDQSLGHATREIMKSVCLTTAAGGKVTCVTVMPIHMLDVAVRITQSAQYQETKKEDSKEGEV